MTTDLAPVIRRNTLLLSTTSAVNSVVLQLAAAVSTLTFVLVTGHAGLLGELLALPGVQANLVPDAHLAVLAIQHGLILCSTDSDFARFPRLRWTNPLAQ